MGRASAGFLEHLVPIQFEKFFVLLRSPRECVNPIEAENVVDAEKMKAMRDCADAFTPPIEATFAHGRPTIQWNAPVLSPLLGEFVVFEVRFRGSATAPVESELLRSSEHVRAVVA